MALGPVQLLVIGCDEPRFEGAVVAELERLRADDTINVLDVLVVDKDESGAIEVAGSESLVAGLLDGADVDLSHLDSAQPDELWSAPDAIRLRDAIRAAGGVPVADAWLAPGDLASIGLAG